MDPVRNPYAPGAGQRPPELAAVQVGLTRFEVAPHEYAARRAEIAARAYLKLAEAHKRFLGRNN